jgi:hypothetical protein
VRKPFADAGMREFSMSPVLVSVLGRLILVPMNGAGREHEAVEDWD